MTEDAIVPLTVPRNAVPLATHVRGTLLVSSLASARTLGLEAKYFEALPAARHDAVRAIVATDWVPMDVAIDHYAAMDTLGLAPAKIQEMGRQTAMRIQGTYLKTIATSLRVAGAVDPASILARTPALLERSFKGGTIGVWRTGPKDARCELLGIPALRSEYMRTGWLGAFEVSLELVARKVHVAEIEKMRTPTSAAFAISWV